MQQFAKSAGGFNVKGHNCKFANINFKITVPLPWYLFSVEMLFQGIEILASELLVFLKFSPGLLAPFVRHP